MIISNLAVLLAERKLKVADLVRSTGINKSTLHKLYNDESVRIDFETIDKICIALDVEVGDLLIFKKNDNNQNDNNSLVTNGHIKK
jgi:putative transcriptional regulator